MVVLYYILKLSVCLILIWAFYQLVLRRLTFYNWNRWYLVVCPALAFLLPLINIAPLLEKNNWTKTPIVTAIPSIPGYQYVNPAVAAAPAANLSTQLLHWLPYIVVAGALVMLVRLLLQYISLLSMRRSSQLLLNGPVKVYQVNKPVIPFSFGNSIFLNQHLHKEEELKEIIRHEFIHVKQRHTLDIIWGEAICIFTWYNPFSWLLRKAIRQNLEFIADRQVLKTGLDKKQYQYLLLKVIGVPTYCIASNFNFKSLKKRIAMMNKNKSARLHLVRFFLLLPVVAIVLVAFRNAAKHRQLPTSAVSANDTTGPAKRSFPGNVQSFHTVNNKVTVTLKNGKIEKYDLNNAEELAAFERKYGGMPAAPVPPTPPVAVLDETVAMPHPDPKSPIAPAPVSQPMPPAQPEINDLLEEAPFNQDDCYNDKGYCLSVVQTQKGKMVIVLHKSKRHAELVYLEDWKNDKKYEEKYGKLPVIPPTPPKAPLPPLREEYDMPENVAEVHVKNYDAVVKTVDGKVERFDLSIEEDKAAYESKYGRRPTKAATAENVASVMGNARAQAVAGVPQAAKKVNEVRNADQLIVAAPDYNAGAAREREIVAVITSDMTTEQLEKIKTELKAKGLTIELVKEEGKDGKITRLQGNVTDGSNEANFSASHFERITISRDKREDGKKGFYIYITDVTERHK